MVTITGKVINGSKYGRVLGFPTANLDRREYVRTGKKVRLGIWAGEAEFLKTYKAAIIIGPIDAKGLPKIEAHLINFKGDLYGKRIKLTLNAFLRPFVKFKNETMLKAQIKKDIINIKKYKYGK